MHNEYDLYHHGVKGMKWGVRRKRNQLSGNVDGVPHKSNRPGESPTQAAKRRVDAGGTIIRESRNVGTTIKETKKANKGKPVYKELESMSDQELRERVNRLNMEQNYSNLMDNKAYREAGVSRVDKLMNNGMAALTVTSSVLSIALAIKQLA